jgi:hypothetical protein
MLTVVFVVSGTLLVTLSDMTSPTLPAVALLALVGGVTPTFAESLGWK